MAGSQQRVNLTQDVAASCLEANEGLPDSVTISNGLRCGFPVVLFSGFESDDVEGVEGIQRRSPRVSQAGLETGPNRCMIDQHRGLSLNQRLRDPLSTLRHKLGDEGGELLPLELAVSVIRGVRLKIGQYREDFDGKVAQCIIPPLREVTQRRRQKPGYTTTSGASCRGTLSFETATQEDLDVSLRRWSAWHRMLRLPCDASRSETTALVGAPGVQAAQQIFEFRRELDRRRLPAPDSLKSQAESTIRLRARDDQG